MILQLQNEIRTTCNLILIPLLKFNVIIHDFVEMLTQNKRQNIHFRFCQVYTSVKFNFCFVCCVTSSIDHWTLFYQAKILSFSADLVTYSNSRCSNKLRRLWTEIFSLWLTKLKAWQEKKLCFQKSLVILKFLKSFAAYLEVFAAH